VLGNIEKTKGDNGKKWFLCVVVDGMVEGKLRE
jgi:hypothetical protein